MKQFFKIMAMTAGMLAAAQAYAGEEITIVASGDIEWSGIKLNTSAFTFYDNGGVSLIDGGWQRLEENPPAGRCDAGKVVA